MQITLKHNGGTMYVPDIRQPQLPDEFIKALNDKRVYLKDIKAILTQWNEPCGSKLNATALTQLIITPYVRPDSKDCKHTLPKNNPPNRMYMWVDMYNNNKLPPGYLSEEVILDYAKYGDKAGYELWKLLTIEQKKSIDT
jgi:hypothetical protein